MHMSIKCFTPAAHTGPLHRLYLQIHRLRSCANDHEHTTSVRHLPLQQCISPSMHIPIAAVSLLRSTWAGPRGQFRLAVVIGTSRKAKSRKKKNHWCCLGTTVLSAKQPQHCFVTSQSSPGWFFCQLINLRTVEMAAKHSSQNTEYGCFPYSRIRRQIRVFNIEFLHLSPKNTVYGEYAYWRIRSWIRVFDVSRNVFCELWCTFTCCSCSGFAQDTSCQQLTGLQDVSCAAHILRSKRRRSRRHVQHTSTCNPSAYTVPMKVFSASHLECAAHWFQWPSCTLVHTIMF